MAPQESQVSYVSLFARELVRALPWGIVFLIVLLIFLIGVKRNFVAMADFVLQSSTQQVKSMMLDPRIVGGFKNTVKNGVNYGVMMGKDTLFRTVADPYFKDEVKKAVDYWRQTGEDVTPPWRTKK